jgi:hypothetical protein
MLSNLKFTNIAKTASAAGGSTAERARGKFLHSLGEQVVSVEAMQRGEAYAAQRKVGGQMKAKRFMPWWFLQNGTYYTQLRYGTAVLSINGNNAIEAGKTRDELLTVYAQVKEAALAGELDEVLQKAAAQRQRKKDTKQAELKVEAPATADKPKRK